MYGSAPELEEIKQRAEAHSLTATDYIIRTALGRLTESKSDVGEHFEQIEQRLDRLERLLFDG